MDTRSTIPARPAVKPRRDSSQAFRAVSVELAAGRAEAQPEHTPSPAMAAATIARLESEKAELVIEVRRLRARVAILERQIG